MRSFVKASTPPDARTLEGRYYTDAAVFELERERIFARSWIAVSEAAALSRPGDFLTREIAGESVIIVRDPHGALHAFYNVCRHRGTRLCENRSGTFGGSIQCPYHAWTYALNGELIAARNMQGVEGFDLAKYPLQPVSMAQLDGLIFVSLEPESPCEVELSGLVGRSERWNIANLAARQSIRYEVAANWKLVFQNYSECYHCPVIHPQLERLSPWDSGRNDASDGTVIGGYSELRAQRETLSSDGKRRREPLRSLHENDLARVYYYAVFPSLLLSLHPDYVMVHYVRPLSVDRTEVVCEWLFEPDVDDVDDAVEFWDLTNRQDWHVSELTQRGVASRAYVPGPYAHAEGLLHAFDRHYLRVLGA